MGSSRPQVRRASSAMTVERGFSMGNRQPAAAARQARQVRTATQIVMLGHGAPGPDPVRSGPATAIVVNGTPYLVDFGPGVVRRAAAAYQKGVVAFGPGVNNLQTVFLTHLHADHTAGYFAKERLYKDGRGARAYRAGDRTPPAAGEISTLAVAR